MDSLVAFYDVPDLAGFYQAARIDLNSDGSADFLIRGICGNGGCEYVIVDGASSRLLGTVFGDAVCATWNEGRTFADIESFSHQSANSGLHFKYRFDGKSYVRYESLDLSGSEVTRLLSRFHSDSHIKGEKP